jgi:hypothetical protein
MSLPGNAADAPQRAYAEPMLWAMQLTLLNLLLQPIGPWWLRWAILLLAALGLVWRRALTHPALWLGLAFLTALRVVADWPLPDNHAYLLSYWCLACGLCFFAENPAAALARNGRWLIGLVFLFASLWKLALSGDYASGLFFRVTMLADPRLEGFARIAGGLSLEQLDSLREHIDVHADGGFPQYLAAPEEPGRFVLIAQAAAWWNMLINAALALVFLVPVTWLLSRCRNALLLCYCVVTYAVATVASFGWLLIAMGVGQTTETERRVRIAYVAVFALILLYREIPWSEVLPMLPGQHYR